MGMKGQPMEYRHPADQPPWINPTLHRCCANRAIDFRSKSCPNVLDIYLLPQPPRVLPSQCLSNPPLSCDQSNEFSRPFSFSPPQNKTHQQDTNSNSNSLISCFSHFPLLPLLPSCSVMAAAEKGISREVQLSMAVSSMFPGFRFSPTDEELISFYLKKKLEGCEKSVEVISEVEIYKYEPWDLPVKSVIQSDNEWFFFSPRGKKYPNGNQTRRATDLGYWKATGKERNVKSGSNVIGTKRTLVFHTGRAPKGERTEWIMHEYNTKDKAQDFLVVCRLRRNNEFRQHSCSNRASSSRMNLSSSLAHSGEQVDSTSESNQKDAAEAAVVESSGDQKDYGSDDFYTEILKDDIINLDESTPHADSNLYPLVFRRSDIEKESQHDAYGVLEWPPNQGSANRRIRLKKREVGRCGGKKLDVAKVGDSRYMVEKARFGPIGRLMNTASSSSIVRGYVQVVIFVLLILLVMFVSRLEVFGMSIGLY